MVLAASVTAASADIPGTIAVAHIADIQRGFNQPTEVAVDGRGRIFILDGANNRIAVFNSQLTFIRSIGAGGQKNGEFRQPVGMDIDKQGHLYVADTGNLRVQVFDGMGKYLHKIDLASRKARPVEVKADLGRNRIYVSDANNHQVLGFDTQGAFQSAWGRLGDQNGQLRYPGMMDMGGKADLFVVDILNGRVQVFDPAGRNPRQIGKLGVLPGQLFRPKGIAVDGDSVYVSDSYTGIIHVFESSGLLRGILGSGSGGEHLRLTTPLGMAIDKQRRLFVVQSTLNTVSVFKLK